MIVRRPPVKAPPTTASFIVFGVSATSWNQRLPVLKYWPTATACFLPPVLTSATVGAGFGATACLPCLAVPCGFEAGVVLVTAGCSAGVDGNTGVDVETSGVGSTVTGVESCSAGAVGVEVAGVEACVLAPPVVAVAASWPSSGTNGSLAGRCRIASTVALETFGAVAGTGAVPPGGAAASVPVPPAASADAVVCALASFAAFAVVLAFPI